MRYLLLILLLFFTTPVFAAAEETIEESPTTWHELIKVLRAHGIHHSQVSWLPIEKLCLGLKKEKDTVPYNRCRLQKAIDQRDYRIDDNECADEGKVAYPDYLGQPRAVLSANESTIVNNQTTQTEISNFIDQGIPRTDLKRGRAVVFRKCMRDRGWRDPYDWGPGNKG